ncbi:hypothetical protein [Cognatiyoonia sp. IB215182]|uniref:hypothetical protein n=1 Tax=Cognatiyoonia sp. IB215182 TaxID=3097353 RepID=UPI002A13E23C|nr:hypothetical protein [Cognatiyoonia sp. IB215182]MDX8353458.1 hypothetical protein [Cognatiyoonia sp. IB215182]
MRLLFQLAVVAMMFGVLAYYASFLARDSEQGRDMTVLERVAAGMGAMADARSGQDIVLAYRRFDADLRFGQLTVFGAVMTFDDIDEPASFTPYNFAFRRDKFTATPSFGQGPYTALYGRYNAEFPKTSGVVTESCINPRANNNTTEDGIALKQSMLCKLDSALPDRPAAMIGIIQPQVNEALPRGGDRTCRTEAAHWSTLPGFEDFDLIFCIVVDLPFDPDAYQASDWMDVITYQRFGSALFNMRAARRNFESIRG